MSPTKVASKLMKAQLLLFLCLCGIFLLVPELMFHRTQIVTPTVSWHDINYIRSHRCVSYKPGLGNAAGHLPPLRSRLVQLFAFNHFANCLVRKAPSPPFPQLSIQEPLPDELPRKQKPGAEQTALLCLSAPTLLVQEPG